MAIRRFSEQPSGTLDAEKRLARLSAFEEVSRAIGASLDLTEICCRALNATLRVVRGNSGAIYVVDRDNKRLVGIAFARLTDEFLAEYGMLPLDERSLTGRAVFHNELQTGAIGRLPPISKKIAATLGSRNTVAVPISSRGKVLGTLNVTLDPRRKVAPEDVELFSDIAAPIGVAIDNAQLHAQSIELNTELVDTGLRLRSLLEAAEDINSRLDVEGVVHRIVELAAYITDASEGLVALGEDNRVVTHEWWDGRNWRPFDFVWEKGEGGPGWVFVSGEPYMSNDASADPHTVPKMVRMMRLRNFIDAPMLSREGDFLGALEVDNKAEGQPFTHEDVDLVMAFARLAAVALQNARLFRDVASTKDLLQTMIDNATAYISYLDASFTVRRVSRKSAAFFGLQPEELLGKNVFDFFPWLREHEIAEGLYEAMRTAQRQEKLEARLSVTGRADTYWDVVFVPTKEHSGKVEGVLSYATDVTDKVRARKDAEERARRDRAVREVALAVNSEASLHDVLRTAVERTAEVLEADMGSIFLFTDSGKRLRAVITTRLEDLPVERFVFDLKDTPISRRALRKKQPVFFGREESSVAARRYFDELGIAKVLGVPLIAAQKSIGLLYLSYYSPRPAPSSGEMDFATNLANQCAIAVDKARLLEEARTQRARLESVVEQMPEGVFIVAAPEGRIILLNRRARQIAGKGLKVGMTVEELTEKVGISHTDGRPYRTEELATYRALNLGQAVRGEEEILRRPGQKSVAVLVGAVPLFDDSGRVREAVVVFQDTTPLKEAQRRAEESAQLAQRQKAEMETVIETLAEGVVITDTTGNILRANRASASILGFKTFAETYPRIENYRFLDLQDPEGRPLPMERWPITRAMRGESFVEQEIIATGVDGRQHHLLAGGSHVRGPRRKLSLAIVVFRDITRIRDLERQREEFISVIAHDLRSALTIVRGYVQLLLRPKELTTLPAEAQKPLEAIATSTKRLERIVSDLLDVSRIEARRLKLVKQTVDLAKLVRSVLERSAELATGHAVQVEAPATGPMVVADPDRIEQVMTNLLSNAGKYSYPDTPITVEVEPREGEAIVSVTNLGMGVRPEDKSRLFTRFHRTEEATREKVPGLGLGLYIAKGLVEAHGGRMWVDSEHGKYAAFRFTLPTA